MQHVNRMPWNRLPKVMKHYSPSGRRNHGRPLKRLLVTWDRNRLTSGSTPWQIYYDDDDLFHFCLLEDICNFVILTENNGGGGETWSILFLCHWSPCKVTYNLACLQIVCCKVSTMKLNLFLKFMVLWLWSHVDWWLVSEFEKGFAASIFRHFLNIRDDDSSEPT